MLNKILKMAGVYFSVSVFNAVLSFALNKYFSVNMVAEDYGLLMLYVSSLTIIASISSLSTASVAAKITYLYDGDERTKKKQETLSFMALSSLVFVVILCFSSSFIERHLDWFDNHYIFPLIIFSILFPFYDFLNKLWVFEGKVKGVAFISILYKLPSFIFIILFVICSKGYVAGRLWGEVFGIVLFISFFTIKHVRSIKFKLEITVIKEMIKLSIPIFITVILSVLSTNIQRFFLADIGSMEEVAMFSLSLYIGTVIVMLSSSITQSLVPLTMSALKKRDNDSLNQVFKENRKFILILLSITTLSLFVSKYIVLLFSDDKYLDASKLIPFAFASCLISFLYKIPYQVIIFHDRVWSFPITMITALTFNIVSSYFIIPLYGSVGATYSVFIGAFIYTFMTLLFSCKLLEIKVLFELISMSLIIFVMFSIYFYCLVI